MNQDPVPCHWLHSHWVLVKYTNASLVLLYLIWSDKLLLIWADRGAGEPNEVGDTGITAGETAPAVDDDARAVAVSMALGKIKVTKGTELSNWGTNISTGDIASGDDAMFIAVSVAMQNVVSADRGDGSGNCSSVW
jgi:hypothetical protein